jgi:phage FluMu protein Com
MTEEFHANKIAELKSELLLKNKEISEYLDKIDYLENMIMEIEASLSKKNDKQDTSLLNIQLKDLEGENRELKNKLSFVRLENIKLKQELEKTKKGYFDTASLIQVVQTNLTSNESKPIDNKETKIREDYTSQKILFNYVRVKCPKCDTLKSLKIPIKIVDQTQNLTRISIPKGMICDHSFQVLIDKSFVIRRYQLVDYEFHKIEFLKNDDREIEEDEDILHFISFPFDKDIINILRESIDDREILGTAIFTDKGKVIYASVPSNLLFNIIKEFEFRNEKELQAMTKMYIEMKNHKKIFSEYIKIINTKVIFVLVFSERVNFGMGAMLFRDLIKKLEIITKNYKVEPI